jgi:hypothetical protein
LLVFLFLGDSLEERLSSHESYLSKPKMGILLISIADYITLIYKIFQLIGF